MASVATRINKVTEEEAKLALLYLLHACANTLEDENFCKTCYNEECSNGGFSTEMCMREILDEVSIVTNAYMNNDIQKILMTVRKRRDE